jgi:hypothetical protein
MDQGESRMTQRKSDEKRIAAGKPPRNIWREVV